ncbi:MAG: cysteine-rich CWC family protein [Myxococcota bacterium]
MNQKPSMDPTCCPLCGASNRCGVASGSSTCWCFEVKMSEHVLAQLPEEARGAACICRACAEADSSVSPGEEAQ